MLGTSLWFEDLRGERERLSSLQALDGVWHCDSSIEAALDGESSPLLGIMLQHFILIHSCTFASHLQSG